MLLLNEEEVELQSSIRKLLQRFFRVSLNVAANQSQCCSVMSLMFNQEVMVSD